MKPVREYIHILLYGSTSAVAWLTRTIIPAALTLWARRIWFVEQPIGKAIDTNEKVLWAVLTVFWFIWLNIFEKRVTEGQWSLDLRQVLLQGRSFAVSHTYRLQKILTDVQAGGHSAATLDIAERLLDFDGTRKDILHRLFQVFSHGNVKLDQHVRVTLLEAEDDQLKVKDWANSENEPPRCLALGVGFKTGKGTAGEAWRLMRPFTVADLAEHRKQLDLVKKGKKNAILDCS